jgi:hypothetical protein
MLRRNGRFVPRTALGQERAPNQHVERVSRTPDKRHSRCNAKIVGPVPNPDLSICRKPEREGLFDDLVSAGEKRWWHPAPK